MSEYDFEANSGFKMKMKKLSLSLKKKKNRMLGKLSKEDVSIDKEYDSLYEIYRNEMLNMQKNRKMFENITKKIDEINSNITDLKGLYLNCIDSFTINFEEEKSKINVLSELISLPLSSFCETIKDDCVKNISIHEREYEKINVLILQRDEKKLDYDTLNSQVKKNSSSRNELSVVKREYKKRAKRVKQSFKAIVRNRKSVYKPISISFFNTSLLFFDKIANCFDEVANQMDGLCEKLSGKYLENEEFEEKFGRKKKVKKNESEESDNEDGDGNLNSEESDIKMTRRERKRKKVFEKKDMENNGTNSNVNELKDSVVFRTLMILAMKLLKMARILMNDKNFPRNKKKEIVSLIREINKLIS